MTLNVILNGIGSKQHNGGVETADTCKHGMQWGRYETQILEACIALGQISGKLGHDYRSGRNCTGGKDTLTRAGVYHHLQERPCTFNDIQNLLHFQRRCFSIQIIIDMHRDTLLPNITYPGHMSLNGMWTGPCVFKYRPVRIM